MQLVGARRLRSLEFGRLWAGELPHSAEPAQNVWGIVQQHENAGPLNRGQAGQDANLRLEEIHAQTKREISDHEELEQIAVAMWAPRKGKNQRRQEKRERDFIELCGMARHAVAKIHSPWKRCGDSSRVIVRAGEKTSDTANRNSHAEWESKQIASPAGNAQIFLGGLHGEQGTDQSADNGFSAQKKRRIAKVSKGARGIFEPVKQLAADHGAYRCCRNPPPPIGIRASISLAAPQLQRYAE